MGRGASNLLCVFITGAVFKIAAKSDWEMVYNPFFRPAVQKVKTAILIFIGVGEKNVSFNKESVLKFTEKPEPPTKQELPRMNKKEFSTIRRNFGKSQLQISQLLGVSLKAVQSFEQGWRNIPVHVERQLLHLLALRQNTNRKGDPCWVLQKCSKEIRENCPAWEFKAGLFCWCICGTICHGKVQNSWQKKMKICRRCEVFKRSVSL